ncbi:putative adhesin [Streptomyces fimicarius]|uniref:putative adhesin n=1 Tax=Streptomyces griseus TaxID=1911 RepID=UPI0036A2E156
MSLYRKREQEGAGKAQPSSSSRMPTEPQHWQALQRAVGNSATTRMILQRRPQEQEDDNVIHDRAGTWTAHRTPRRDDGSTVLSGHGKYDLRNGAGLISVPEGTTVQFYSQHGQGVSDSFAGRVERGENGSEMLEGKRKKRDIEPVSDSEGDEPEMPPELAKLTYGPGEAMPDYSLFHPVGLHIHGNPIQLRRRKGPYDFRGTYVVGLRDEGPVIIDELRQLGGVAPDRTVTVEEEARLSALLKPDMGVVHFVACRSVVYPTRSVK